LGTRYGVPHIDNIGRGIEAAASRVLGTKVLVEQIETDGAKSDLRLVDVRLYDATDTLHLACATGCDAFGTSVATLDRASAPS